MHIPCQTSKKHQSGLARTNREEAPRRWSDSPHLKSGGEAIRPGGWSDLAHPPGGKTGTGADKGKSGTGEIRDGSEFSVATRDAHAQSAPVPDFLLRLRHPERRLPRPADASVMRGQRQPAGAGRGHDESIGRILVKGRRQAIHLRDDGGRDGDHFDRGR